MISSRNAVQLCLAWPSPNYLFNFQIATFGHGSTRTLLTSFIKVRNTNRNAVSQ